MRDFLLTTYSFRYSHHIWVFLRMHLYHRCWFLCTDSTIWYHCY